MPGFGISPYGLGSYGSVSAASSDVSSLEVAEVDCYAQDLVYIRFSKSVLNNSIAKSTSIYSITPKNNTSITPVIYEVKSGNDDTTSEIWLVINGFTIGEKYTITVNNIQDTTGTSISSEVNFGSFIGRETKIDNVIRYFPRMYDTSNASLLRQIINCIFRQDDLLGGSASE